MEHSNLQWFWNKIRQEETKILMAGFEKFKYESEYEEGFSRGYSRGFQSGLDKAQKKDFDNLVKYLVANESLSKSEAEEKALSALSLGKVPV